MISQISFGSSRATIECRKRTKEGLQMAEQILRASESKYGRPRSYSFVWVKALQHQGDPKYKGIIERLESLADKYREAMLFQPWDDVTRFKLSEIKDRNYHGNCDKCAEVVQHEFFARNNQPTINIIMDVERSDGQTCNHVFNVLNIGAKADPKKPETWAKEAIVTDLWGNIVKKANEAIDYYYKLFKINSSDKVTFDYMISDDNPLQNYFLGRQMPRR